MWNIPDFLNKTLKSTRLILVFDKPYKNCLLVTIDHTDKVLSGSRSNTLPLSHRVPVSTEMGRKFWFQGGHDQVEFK